MKKVIISIVAIGIVTGISVLFVMNKPRTINEQQGYSTTTTENDTVPAQLPYRTSDEDSPKESDNAPAKTEFAQPLTKGMMLRATGTVYEIIQDTGGDPADPSIPPTQIIISLDSSLVKDSSNVRISNEGCIDDKLFSRGDKVVVSGTIVNIIPDIGIILSCDQGAHIEHL